MYEFKYNGHSIFPARWAKGPHKKKNVYISLWTATPLKRLELDSETEPLNSYTMAQPFGQAEWSIGYTESSSVWVFV